MGPNTPSPESMLERVLALGHERCNFQVGEPWTSGDVERVEARIRRRLPQSWARFFMVYGNGSFFVKGLGYYSNDAPQSEIALRHFVPDDDGWGREDNFDVEFSKPNWYEKDGYQRDLFEDYEGHWLEIGSKPDGDALIIRTGEPGTNAPEDGEVAWHNHETGLRSYRWPSFASFWEHMLVLNAETPQSEKAPRGDHPIIETPPIISPSRRKLVFARAMLFGGLAVTGTVCVLMLMDTTRVDNWWWRAAAIGSSFILLVGFLLGAPRDRLVRNAGPKGRDHKEEP